MLLIYEAHYVNIGSCLGTLCLRLFGLCTIGQNSSGFCRNWFNYKREKFRAKFRSILTKLRTIRQSKQDKMFWKINPSTFAGNKPEMPFLQRSIWCVWYLLCQAVILAVEGFSSAFRIELLNGGNYGRASCEGDE